MDLSSDIWNEFKTADNGIKILVTGEADNLKSAFFKDQTRRATATIFNEYIAYQLACIINYPVPKVQFLKFGEVLGIISFNIPESVVFQGFPKDNLLNLLVDNKVFAKIAAFDFWIKSTDRHDRNLIVQRVGMNQYKVFMIDHEHSLYGADATQPNILDFSNIIKIVDFKSYIPNQDMLIEEAKTISNVTDEEITNLIASVRNTSDGVLTEECANIIKDLLVKRKPLLQEKLLEWYNS